MSDTAVKCPKCGSEHIAAGTRGFGLKKATAGGLLLGPVGLLGGLIGSKKVTVTCLKCGHSWEPVAPVEWVRPLLIREGDRAPDFSGVTADGSRIQLAD